MTFFLWAFDAYVPHRRLVVPCVRYLLTKSENSVMRLLFNVRLRSFEYSRTLVLHAWCQTFGFKKARTWSSSTPRGEICTIYSRSMVVWTTTAHDLSLGRW